MEVSFSMVETTAIADSGYDTGVYTLSDGGMVAEYKCMCGCRPCSDLPPAAAAFA